MSLGIDSTTNAARVAFGSVGSSYSSVLNLTATTKEVCGLVLANTTDKEVVISLNAGTNDAFYMPTASIISVDFRSLGISCAPHVQVKYAGAAPGSGGVSCGAMLGTT